MLWSFVREGVTELVMFPSSMILGRLLTPREFGIAVAALFFTQLAGRLSELGFNAAIVRAKVIEPIHLSSVFVINLTVGVLTFGALTALAPAVAAFYDQPETGQILPIAAISFLIVPFGSVSSGILVRNLRFKEAAKVDWYQGLTFAMGTVVLAWNGFSYMSMVYARLGAVTVQTGCRLYYSRWRPSLRFSKAAIYDVLSFGLGMFAKRLLDYLASNIDNLVIGRLFGMVTLGLYDKAFSTMNRFLTRMNNAGPNVMFRIFSVINEEPQRFRRAYRKVILSTSLLGVPVFAVLAATAPQLMVVLFGDNWLPAAAPFQLLCVSAVLKLLNTYASSATQAAGRIWSEVWRQAGYAALIVASLIALRQWGAVGAAGGVLFATAMMSVLMHLLLRRVTQLEWADIVQPLAPALVCAGACVGAVFATQAGVEVLRPAPSPWLLLGCQGVAAVLAYAAFMLFAPIPPLRALVYEMARDLAPKAVKRHRLFQMYLASQAPALESGTPG
ncbi:MAG: lipopolysaccharide biosynthesis protein [Vicinamibacterales bacterium]